MHIRQPQLSTKFAGTLFHASDADSNAIRLQFRNSLVDSLAIVSHRNHDHPFLLRQRNPHLACFRMPEDVGQRLLNDSEDCGLHFRGQPRKIARLYVE